MASASELKKQLNHFVFTPWYEVVFVYISWTNLNAIDQYFAASKKRTEDYVRNWLTAIWFYLLLCSIGLRTLALSPHDGKNQEAKRW